MTRISQKAIRDTTTAAIPMMKRRSASPKNIRRGRRRKRKRKDARKKKSHTMRTIWISSTMTKNLQDSRKRKNHEEKAMRTKTLICTTWDRTTLDQESKTNLMTIWATIGNETSQILSQRFKKLSISKKTFSIPLTSENSLLKKMIGNLLKLTYQSDILPN
jgi:hypothetical protein